MGMHRSGTSAMARLLSLCGLQLPNLIIPAGPDNPAGFWEPRRVTELNERILAAAGTGWEDPCAFQACALLASELGGWIAAARQALSLSYPAGAPIVVKDPRLSLLAPIWLAAARLEGYEPSVIVMVRPAAEIAASLAARNGTAFATAQLLYIAYMVSAERHTRAVPRSFVNFDGLLRGPISALESVLGDIMKGDKGAARLEEMERFIDPALRHHHPNNSMPASLSEPADEIDRAMAAASQGRRVDRQMFDRTAQWLTGLLNWLSPLLSGERARLVLLERQVQQHKAFEQHVGNGVIELQEEIKRLSDLSIAQHQEISRLSEARTCITA